MAQSVALRYAVPGYGDRRVWVRGPGWPDHCQVTAAYALRLNSRASTEGSTVSSLICDRWLILDSETLSISRCLNGEPLITDGFLLYARARHARTAKLDTGAHGTRCACRVHLDFLTRGISVVSGSGRVRGEDLNLSAIQMYIVSMISSRQPLD